jgi:hypothetical protein
MVDVVNIFVAGQWSADVLSHYPTVGAYFLAVAPNEPNTGMFAQYFLLRHI